MCWLVLHPACCSRRSCCEVMTGIRRWKPTLSSCLPLRPTSSRTVLRSPASSRCCSVAWYGISPWSAFVPFASHCTLLCSGRPHTVRHRRSAVLWPDVDPPWSTKLSDLFNGCLSALIWPSIHPPWSACLLLNRLICCPWQRPVNIDSTTDACHCLSLSVCLTVWHIDAHRCSKLSN